MKIAYLFFAYRNPRLIKREIEILSSDKAAFYIHIDGKVDISSFTEIKGPNIHFSEKRIPVYWAEFSGVRAVIELMKQALAGPERCDYLFLLSGSEYPIRTRNYIEEFLEANSGTEFIRLIKVPGPGKPLSRLTTIRYESDRPVRRFLSRAFAKVGMSQRDFHNHLGTLEPYSGRTWWALTREACEYILRFDEENPDVAAFFRDTFAPEEAYFHTILGNSKFKERACGNLVYEDWSARGAHPAIITAKHLDHFEKKEKVFDLYEGPSELLFARKFSDDSLALFSRIDRMAKQKGDLLSSRPPLYQTS
jgi:hypothetical protein